MLAEIETENPQQLELGLKEIETQMPKLSRGLFLFSYAKMEEKKFTVNLDIPASNFITNRMARKKFEKEFKKYDDSIKIKWI